VLSYYEKHPYHVSVTGLPTTSGIRTSCKCVAS
jgi:hypothetical protein